MAASLAELPPHRHPAAGLTQIKGTGESAATLAGMTSIMDRLSVAKVTRLGAVSENACLELARSLEASSRHPAARVFRGEEKFEVAAARTFPGRGIEALVDGRRVRIGTEAFCRELCGFPPAGPAHPNFDACFVFLAEDRAWLAAFELEDSLRPEGAALARALWMENCAAAI